MSLDGGFIQLIGGAIVILVVAYIVIRMMPQLIEKIFATVPGLRSLDKTLTYFIADSVGIFMVVAVAAFGLTKLPESATLIALLVTVASGAFIFTSEGWIQDAFAGISLQLYRQYQVNDLVTLGNNHRGKVLRIGLFRTDLETLELDVISVRNSRVLSEDVINHSGIFLREVDIIVHVVSYGDYGDKISEFQREVLNVAQSVQDKLCTEASRDYNRYAQVYFMDFGPSSDHQHIIYYVYDKDEDFRIAVDAMHTAIAETFRPQGVVLGQTNSLSIDSVVQVQSLPAG